VFLIVLENKHIFFAINKSEYFSYAPFDLIHFDNWGPAPITNKGGSCYLLSLLMIILVTLWCIYYKIYINFCIFIKKLIIPKIYTIANMLRIL
jgi:hypothetical protein